jgi:hypothetical protein
MQEHAAIGVAESSGGLPVMPSSAQFRHGRVKPPPPQTAGAILQCGCRGSVEQACRQRYEVSTDVTAKVAG